MMVNPEVVTSKGKRELPNGWKWVRLGEVCELRKGRTPHEEWYADSGCRLVRFRDLKGGHVDWTEGFRSFVSSQYAELLQPLLARTVLITSDAHDPTSIGKKIAYVEDPPEAFGVVYYSGEMIAVRASDESLIEPTWAFLWLSSEAGYVEIQEHVDGVHLNSGPAREILMPLPPLSDQKRIAAILNEQMAAVERARAAAEAQLEAAKALPAAYLHAVFDSPEAQQWPKARLGKILELRKDVVHPRDNPRGTATFVGLEHLESGTGVRTGSIDVEMAELTGRKPRFYKGDIVYGYLRPYLNKVWVAEFDGLCSVDQYVYKVDEKKVETDFVAWFMRSPLYLKRAPIKTTPGQLPRIRTEEVASVEVNLPPLPEQRRVMAVLTGQLAAAAQTRKALEEQLDTINKLPAALLRGAFSGEV